MEVLGLQKSTPAASSDLDALYGAMVIPKKVDQKEGELSPRSLHILDDSSASLLKDLTSITERGLGVSAYVYCELPILWIIDANGKILFALEEVVHTETNEFALPRLRNTDVKDGFARLGHPSLVSAMPARIAGEILFDVRADVPRWFITNASGRYGIGHDRTKEHLEEVCRCFEEYGIALEPYFIHPVERS